MSHKVICQWLELPAERWPPDHYALLGLERGESRLEHIEEHVHQRLLTLRQYQLSHPEHATEAMNCIARAFMCLTDAEAKRAYDAKLKIKESKQPGPDPEAKQAKPQAEQAKPQAEPVAKQAKPQAEPAPVKVAARAEVEEAARPTAEPAKQLDWSSAPPPQRQAPAESEPDELEGESVEETPPILMSEPADPVLETARSSRVARSGLGTRTALYDRIFNTRELLSAWDRAGRYLNKPARRIKRRSEAKELVKNLRLIRDCLREFPPLLGRAGLPGYLVSALSRQAMILPTFRGLSSSQREALARDWQSARTLLWLHRCFLLEELRKCRRKGAAGRAWRAVSTPVVDHPILSWMLITALVVNVSLWLYVYW